MPTAIVPNPLPALARRINERHASGLRSAGHAIEEFRLAGVGLIEARAALAERNGGSSHGLWGDWCEENLTFCAADTVEVTTLRLPRNGGERSRTSPVVVPRRQTPDAVARNLRSAGRHGGILSSEDDLDEDKIEALDRELAAAKVEADEAGLADRAGPSGGSKRAHWTIAERGALAKIGCVGRDRPAPWAWLDAEGYAVPIGEANELLRPAGMARWDVCEKNSRPR